MTLPHGRRRERSRERAFLPHVPCCPLAHALRSREDMPIPKRPKEKREPREVIEEEVPPAKPVAHPTDHDAPEPQPKPPGLRPNEELC